ncbi:cytochrome P450 family protein [Ceratobasidium sp. AG-Ba]|nr:cytochrome P450 family protein [Ceratobasidium sp. AG-Ba]
MDSATEFLFGVDVRSLGEPLCEEEGKSMGFANAFRRVQEKVITRFTLVNLWPYFEMFWDRTGGEMRVIDGYIAPILRKKLEAKKRGESKATNGGEEAEALLDFLVRHTDDEKIIKDELTNILVAGRDTVGPAQAVESNHFANLTE